MTAESLSLTLESLGLEAVCRNLPRPGGQWVHWGVLHVDSQLLCVRMTLPSQSGWSLGCAKLNYAKLITQQGPLSLLARFARMLLFLSTTEKNTVCGF
jgi:hypothetical protein